MRVRRATSLVLTAGVTLAMAAAAALPASAAPHQAEPWSPPGAGVLRGDLPPGAEHVEVELEPTGSALARLPVGARVVARPLPASLVAVTGGHLEVRLRPGAVRWPYVDRHGVVTFHVRAEGPGGQVWATSASFRAVTGLGRAWWVDPEAEVRGVRLPRLTRVATPVGVARTTPLGARTADSGCPDHVILQREVVWATIGTTYPIGASRARMVVRSSRGGRYGITDSVGEYHPIKAGSVHAGGDWGAVWSWAGGSRSYRKQIAYVLHRWGHRDSHYRCVLEYSWMPTVETGGVGEHRSLPRPTWGHCVPVPSGYRWIRYRSDGTPYRFSAGVSIARVIGVNLGVRRNYSDYQRVEYDIRGSRAKRICGSNTWPSVSGKQMERYR